MQAETLNCPKNFARCSGVIVDICKGHGTWFDRDELSRIVEFIRAGGLEMARTKEKVELEEERRRLRQEQLKLDLDVRAILVRTILRSR